MNLFLHVTGRRADGYHSIESLFALIDLCDTVTLTPRDDDTVARANDVAGVAADDDLAVRAARALQREARVGRGVTLRIDKRIPMGAGLGGGSSDAASVLLALNRLWQLDWSRAQLREVGRSLGADVPFFVGGQNAVARGTGEELRAVTLPSRWLVVMRPAAHVSTGEIFASPDLTRDTPEAETDVFPDEYGRNDLAAVTARIFPQVADALRHAPGARMTGSGACVFVSFATRAEAEDAMGALPRSGETFLTRTLARHPLAGFAR